MVLKGSTLTVENAQLEDNPSAPSPTVRIELDGRPHTVVDSVDRGQSLEVTGRLESGSVLVTTMVAGRPVSQTISLDKTQLVVVSSGAASTFIFSLRQEVTTDGWPRRESQILAGSQALCGVTAVFEYWSGRPDSNRRPPAPKAGALPDCATPRPSL